MTEKRKPGGQPGNKCAAKTVHAKRVTFRLYPADRLTLDVLAARWNVSKSEAMRMALRMAIVSEIEGIPAERDVVGIPVVY